VATDSPSTLRLTGQCTLKQGPFVRLESSLSATARPQALAIVLAILALLALALASPSSAAESLDLSRHAGRVVVVDFWASWCKPCRQSIPWLNTLKARYGASGLTLIGVNVDAERRDAERFMRDIPFEFEVVFDPDGNIARQFKVQAMPTTYVIDRSGKIVETHLGFRESRKSETEAAIRTLLDAPAR
jgi:cytochrome c biogenesis protein CcmG/thiol:disulfide interchange protein DsbE